MLRQHPGIHTHVTLTHKFSVTDVNSFACLAAGHITPSDLAAIKTLRAKKPALSIAQLDGGLVVQF